MSTAITAGAGKAVGKDAALQIFAKGLADDMPGYNVFARKDGVIRHFWRSEGGKETADPGQDSHDAPDMSALWVILNTTPEGRGTDWYPKLDDK